MRIAKDLASLIFDDPPKLPGHDNPLNYLTRGELVMYRYSPREWIKISFHRCISKNTVAIQEPWSIKEKDKVVSNDDIKPLRGRLRITT
jgi:hypothetical protein